MPKKSKTAKKKNTKKSAHQRAAAKPRLICFECGRQLTVDSWGAAVSSILCCGHDMAKR